MAMERIVWLNGPQRGQAIPIEGKLNIGRHHKNQLQLDDPKVSRKHALIELTQQGAMLLDLNSGNGTFVGQRRILEYRLAHGDILSFGEQQFRFECVVQPGSHSGTETPPRDAVEPMHHDDAAPVASSAPKSTEATISRMDNSRMETKKPDQVVQTLFSASRGYSTEMKTESLERRLHALYEANKIISDEQDLKKLFQRVMEQVFALMPAHNGAILLTESEKDETLIPSYVQAGRQPDAESVKNPVALSTTIIKKAFESAEAVISFNAATDKQFTGGESIIAQNIASVMCAPMLYQGETLGVIYVDTRGATHAFTDSDLEMLVALAGPAAIAIKNAQYVQKLEQAYEDTLTALADAIEMRDHYTVGHTWRVTNFAMAIARELGWSEEKLKEVQMGGVLHDVGKIAVEDSILRKNGPLSDAEYEKIKIHPEKGAQLLNNIEHLKLLTPYCLYHHERYDGKGYPLGVKGDDIPIEGRVMAVADTFDALTSNRPYRKGMAPDKAIEIIEEGMGSQFDPTCADALIRCYREGKIDEILQDYLRSDRHSIACPFCSTFIRVPEAAQEDDIFTCTVCHREIRLSLKNDSYFGELMARHSSEATPDIATPGILP